MNITSRSTKNFPRLLEILAVALVYVLTARLSQIFAIEPGNITPVWIPSGIMLSWVILRGHFLLAGVFLGHLPAMYEPISILTTSRLPCRDFLPA
jgi:integral membrane sensor domain MASE1